MNLPRKKVLSLFGTRPEVIKFAPILRQLERTGSQIQAINVASAQHTDLLYPLSGFFKLRIDHDLHAMPSNQSLAAVRRRIVRRLLPVLDRERPDIILVQGDTSTALAGSIAGAMRRIPVGHVEAGLRSGNLAAPFPEESYRRTITRLAKYHFAPTGLNRDTLLREGVASENIFLTGNPGIDSLLSVPGDSTCTPGIERILAATQDHKRIVLTAHRRENFGPVMDGHFRTLRRFTEAHEDVAVIFPMHPNPAISASACILRGHPRIHLMGALSYPDFVHLMRQAWLIVSDSGGVQEEAPSLGKPLLILRGNTERPEAVMCGAARLAGESPESLARALEQTWRDRARMAWMRPIPNPFGRGDSGARIAESIQSLLLARRR
jgi:UDP-N-acetylglucosamine 2-epimerase (non-hydrolysing)